LIQKDFQGDRVGSMTSTDGGRKMDFNSKQSWKAAEARYQHADLTDTGMVIAVRHSRYEKADERNGQMDERQSK
jgi:hypothetical protein